MSTNNERMEIILKDMHSELAELLKWIKISSFGQIQEMLERVLDSDSKKIIYQLSDGNLTRKEIITKAKVSFATITKLWNQWSKLGIEESISVGDKHSFDLNYNLLPKMKSLQKKAET